MEQVSQRYVRRKLDELTPHPANPRQGDVGAIHQSIEANGFYGAVIVQKSTGYVLAGNHRMQAAAHAGAKSLPVIEVDVDDATATRILLADNRTNDVATYDQDALAGLLKSLAEDGGLAGSGYDGDDVDALLQAMTHPSTDEWQTAASLVKDGEPDLVQMTFILTAQEKAAVAAAMDAVLHSETDVRKFTQWMRSTGLTSARINELTGTFMGGHYTSTGSQPAIPSRKAFEMLRPHINEVPEWVNELVQAPRSLDGKNRNGTAIAKVCEAYLGRERGTVG